MCGRIDDEGMSQRLTSLDATFLELEDADECAHMHIGAVMVFEATGNGPPWLDQLRTEIAHRLELLPRYRSKLDGAARRSAATAGVGARRGFRSRGARPSGRTARSGRRI